MKRFISPLVCFLLSLPQYGQACSRLPITAHPNFREMSAIEANFAASELIFLGFLTSISTTAVSSADQDDYFIYKFRVIKPLKGSLASGELVTVRERRSFCTPPRFIRRDYFAYLEIDEHNAARFGRAYTREARDITIDLDNKDDRSFYESVKGSSMFKDYTVTDTYNDGSPKKFVFSKEAQLKKLENFKLMNSIE